MTLTYYHILGVNEDATPAEIKRAFREISKRDHPDHNAGDAAAEARFKIASEAYATLSDPGKRKAYDRELKGSTGSGAASGNGSGSAEPEQEPRAWTKEEEEAYRRFGGGTQSAHERTSRSTPPPGQSQTTAQEAAARSREAKEQGERQARRSQEQAERTAAYEREYEAETNRKIVLFLIGVAVLIVLIVFVAHNKSGGTSTTSKASSTESRPAISYRPVQLSGGMIGPIAIGQTKAHVDRELGPPDKESITKTSERYRLYQHRKIEGGKVTLVFETDDYWQPTAQNTSLLEYCTSSRKFGDRFGIGVGSTLEEGLRAYRYEYAHQLLNYEPYLNPIENQPGNWGYNPGSSENEAELLRVDSYSSESMLYYWSKNGMIGAVSGGEYPPYPLEHPCQ